MGTFVGDIKPRFAKSYLNGGQLMTEALGNYVREVKERLFPFPENIYELESSMAEEMHESIRLHR
jgi:ketopantoate hydroxymethyltransferase